MLFTWHRSVSKLSRTCVFSFNAPPEWPIPNSSSLITGIVQDCKVKITMEDEVDVETVSSTLKLLKKVEAVRFDLVWD